jgi:hypothetical protein
MKSARQQVVSRENLKDFRKILQPFPLKFLTRSQFWSKPDNKSDRVPRVAQLVEALRYKPEGYGFDSRWCYLIFYCHNPSGHTMGLGSTQPLTKMSTRNIFWGLKAAGA